MVLATGCLGLDRAAFAQVTLPPAVNPGRLQEQFQPPAKPRAAPEISVPAAPGNVAPPGADTIELQLDTIVIEGATVYSADELAKLTAPYLKRRIVLSDLFKLADELTAKYRSDGYILSQAIVPAQHIGNTARIVIIEGFVSEVHVQGYDSARLEAYGQHILDSRPLKASDLERYMLLANDLSGVTARAVLAPSVTIQGGAALTIVTEQKPVDVQLAMDNRGTKFIGPYQFYAGGGVNIPSLDERLAARYIRTPSAHELQYGEMSFTQPLGSDGLRLVLYGNVSHSFPGYTLSQFHSNSDGSDASATLSYPILRGRDQNLEVRGVFDIRDLTTVVNFTSAAPPSSNDHLRVFRAGASYDLADPFSGVNLLALQVSKGVSAFGASADFNRTTPSRPLARSDFSKLTGEVSRQQDLQWIYPGLGLLGAYEFQHSFAGPLPSSEQFGLGGPLYGRAYSPSDITGDEGWGAKAELQYTAIPPGGLSNWWNSYQLYGFYDKGHVMRNVATAGAKMLSSAGFGVRLALFDKITSDLEFAKPLTRDESIALNRFHARPWRFFVSVGAHF